MKIITPKRRLYNLKRDLKAKFESIIFYFQDFSERKLLIAGNITLIAIIIIVLKLKGI